MLAGLLPPDTGFIAVNGKVWYDAQNRINLPPQKRSIGFVFQDYALFPNMTVKQNLSFALGKNQSPAIIKELIQTVELTELQHRKPATLSGGQQQRVALARALVRKPDLLLLDEPLSALDQSIRVKLQDYILASHRKYGLTTLLVTHDQSEINKLTDQVLIIEEGKIINQGTPEELFSTEIPKKGAHLEGIFLGLKKRNDQYWLLLKIKGETITIPVGTDRPTGLMIGQPITIDINTGKMK